MFKQLHINTTLADALILIPKYQKMLKALISNKKKLLKLANTPLNENCFAVILKKLPEKLGDPGKILILYGFSDLKYKALAIRDPLILERPFLRTTRALIDEMDSIFKDSIDEDNLADLNDNLVDTMPEMFIDEHALD
nr:reverse transcriptase domain-containing protein [Tanacetum cinerariifolium]